MESYTANGIHKLIQRVVSEDMPLAMNEGAEISISLPPATAQCVFQSPDGQSTMIQFEAESHQFTFSPGSM